MFEIITGESVGVVATGGVCPVCHSHEIAFDAVERGPQVWMQLAECGHCDHRWTLPEPARSARGVVRATGAVASGSAASREGARAA